MHQILQDIKSGELTSNVVPIPVQQSNGLRIRTVASLISAGTEKMLIKLGQKNIAGKANARPDLVRQVINKAQKEGWWNTFQTVRAKMERPMPLGYSAAGIVEGVGEEVYGFKPGDRVAMAGAGYANHAEINSVPKNLVTLIPKEVSFEEAAYTTVASIAIQGIRLAKPALGDQIAVIGLGLIGLITVQLLKANGCRVIGVDLDAGKVERALALGMDKGVVSTTNDPEDAIERFTRGREADCTIITAATKGNGPIELAGEITRRKGQVIAVGAVGMDVPRDTYYHKELELKVSMSYGPGRYDPSYEEGGVDYPYEYVRWTEQRNMEAVLDMMAAGSLDVKALTTHRFPFERALEAYDLIQSEEEPYVGVLLEYDVEKLHPRVVRTASNHQTQTGAGQLGVAFVGAGNYAARFLLPHLQKEKQAKLQGLVTATGLNAQQKADKFGFGYCTTELQSVLEDEAVDAVFIATRHSTHAEFTVRALEAGKHVFVEKPMVVNRNELEAVRSAHAAANEKAPAALMVGLNRRFAPMVISLKEALPALAVKQMNYRVNSGSIPVDSWLHRPEEGGGMLVGEMCHFIDLMQFLSDERPVKVYAQALQIANDRIADRDNLNITVSFSNGSVGTLAYNTVGDKAAAKERVEVYSNGTVAVLDDFRRLEITRNGRSKREKSRNQDKGQKTEMAETVRSFRQNEAAPIPFVELLAGMEVIFAAQESMRSGLPVDVPQYQAESVEVA